MSSRLHLVMMLFLSLALAAGAAAGCSPTEPITDEGLQTEPVSDEGLGVFVSILPQKYFVERIGGENVAVEVIVEPGASPATYEPKPEQLRALSDAAAYFSIGVPFENAWLERIAESNPDMVVVDTIAGIERMAMPAHDHDEGEGHEHEEGEEHDADTADHEDEHEHEAGAPDPHVWLSPELVKVQAQTIHDALVQLDPDREDEYSANLDAFVADIDQLEADIRATLSNLESSRFLVFHPAWGYFAQDFGLTQIPVEVGGQEPSAQELANVIAAAQEAGIRVVFAQPEFSTQDAETIAREIVSARCC